MEFADRALREDAEGEAPGSPGKTSDAAPVLNDGRKAAAGRNDGRDAPWGPNNATHGNADWKRPQLSHLLAMREEVRGLAKKALTQSPLEARAFRLLGDVAPEGSGEPFMRAALRRSLSESRAAYSLMKTSFVKQKYADAARYADILLRSQPNMMKSVAPYLVRMAETEDASADVIRLLTTHPPWRAAFFIEAFSLVTNAGTPLRLMLPLKSTRFPATQYEVKSYLHRLMGARLYDFAYFVWDQNLTGEERNESGLLFNGDFNHVPTIPFFDWTIGSGTGVTIQIAPLPDDPRRRGLGLAYGPGRADPHNVTEYIKLVPGPYRMTGSYRGDLAGRGGLRWRVLCAAGDVLGESAALLGGGAAALGSSYDWKQFQFSFVTPEKDCRVQYAMLDLAARSTSEWTMSGSLWFTDLKIEPIAAEAAVNSRRANQFSKRGPPPARAKSPVGPQALGSPSEAAPGPKPPCRPE